MIRIELDMEIPISCSTCPLVDEEFYYCHGKRDYNAWELNEIYRYDLPRP